MAPESGSLTKDHLPRVSRQSHLSANDNGDNEMTQKAVHRFASICLAAEENPGKPHLGDSKLKAVRPVVVSNGVPYLRMRSVESYSTSGRKEAGATVRGKPWPLHQ